MLHLTDKPVHKSKTAWLVLLLIAMLTLRKTGYAEVSDELLMYIEALALFTIRQAVGASGPSKNGDDHVR